MLRQAAFDILSRVRQEFVATQLAMSHTLATWHEIPLGHTQMDAVVTIYDLRRAAENLDPTFIIRIFAAFEGILRDYWTNGLRRTTEPPMQDLLDGIAARRKMNPADLDAAHQVREYRNELIHEDLTVRRLDMRQTVRALGSYLRWLPQTW
jgi:hypothetical protein